MLIKSAEREIMLKYHVSTELPKDVAGRFKEYCRDFHLWYETSECGNFIHFEVLATDEEIRKANEFIDTL